MERQLKIIDYLGTNRGIESPKATNQRNKKIKIISQFENISNNINGESTQEQVDHRDPIQRVFSKNREYSFDQPVPVGQTPPSVFTQNVDGDIQTDLARVSETDLDGVPREHVWGFKSEAFDKELTISGDQVDSQLRLKRSRAQLDLKASEKDGEGNLLEPDESIMEDVLKNFEQVGDNTRSKLRQILSKEYLEVDSVGSQSKRDSLLRAKR